MRKLIDQTYICSFSLVPLMRFLHRIFTWLSIDQTSCGFTSQSVSLCKDITTLSPTSWTKQNKNKHKPAKQTQTKPKQGMS